MKEKIEGEVEGYLGAGNDMNKNIKLMFQKLIYMDEELEHGARWYCLIPDGRTSEIWYIFSQEKGIIERFCSLERD